MDTNVNPRDSPKYSVYFDRDQMCIVYIQSIVARLIKYIFTGQNTSSTQLEFKFAKMKDQDKSTKGKVKAKRKHEGKKERLRQKRKGQGEKKRL